MSGTVGICAQETGRYSAFAESLAVLQTPSGTAISWAYGGDLVNGRNLLADTMQGDWIWMMDDDHAFQPDLLMRLLSHEVEVVVPVCLMRQQPFYPVERVAEDQAMDMRGAPKEGLVACHSAGTAGMLIRRPVLDRVRAGWAGPIFEHGDVSEDYLFCARLRELGIPVYVDLGSMLGHMTATAIWPGRGPDGEWCVNFVISDSYLVQVGIAPPEE